MPGKRTIYVLKSDDGKFFYVGRSTNVEARMRMHSAGEGSRWAKLYGCHNIVTKFIEKYPQQETILTIEYMMKYGIEKVRGGIFCKEKLTSEEEVFLRKIEKNEINVCQKCAKKCKTPGCSSDVSNNPIYVSKSENGKYFIGELIKSDMKNSLCCHNKNTHWQYIHKCDKNIETIDKMYLQHISTLTIEYMARYGIDNVRGGILHLSDISESDMKILKDIEESSEDFCHGCPVKHVLQKCPKNEKNEEIVNLYTGTRKRQNNMKTGNLIFGNITKPVSYTHLTLPTIFAV